MIKAIGTNGNTFSLETLNISEWGDVELLFEFDLSWVKGSIKALCSSDRFRQFENFVKSAISGTECEHDFINEDGNIEIKVKGSFTGHYTLEIIASPNMLDDDGIEFSFEGNIEAISETPD